MCNKPVARPPGLPDRAPIGSPMSFGQAPVKKFRAWKNQIDPLSMIRFIKATAHFKHLAANGGKMIDILEALFPSEVGE